MGPFGSLHFLQNFRLPLTISHSLPFLFHDVVHFFNRASSRDTRFGCAKYEAQVQYL